MCVVCKHASLGCHADCRWLVRIGLDDLDGGILGVDTFLLVSLVALERSLVLRIVRVQAGRSRNYYREPLAAP